MRNSNGQNGQVQPVRRSDDYAQADDDSQHPRRASRDGRGFSYSTWVGLVLLAGSQAFCAAETIELAKDLRVAARQSAELTFDLADLPEGTQIRLYLDARIEWGSLGGNTCTMKLECNGNPLRGEALMNKPLIFTMRNGRKLYWARRKGRGYRVMYSPDFSDRIRTDENYIYGLPDDEPYRFGWDITPYARVGANLVKVSSSLLPLRLRDICVEMGEPIPSLNVPEESVRAAPAPSGPVPVYVPTPRTGMPVTIETTPTGGIRFQIGSRELRVRSRTSLPRGRWTNEESAADAWRDQRRGESSTAKWQGPDYAVERRVTLTDDHISVADTVLNTSTELVGVILENRLDLPDRPVRTLFGGVESRLKRVCNPANPTVIAELEGLAVGLVAEDDVLRIHSCTFKKAGCIGLSDPKLGIAPGRSHTLEWSIYAIADGDYWDVVNAIRKDWGTNVALRGPQVFVGNTWEWQSKHLTADRVRQWLQDHPVTVVMTYLPIFPGFPLSAATVDNPFNAHGPAVLRCKSWCDNTRHQVRLLKEIDPAVDVFAYTHHNLCTELGYAQKYRDSLVLDGEGKPRSTVYKPEMGHFLPTLENSYGRALMEVNRFLVEELGCHIYIDEITASNANGFAPYATWDGCTAVIDPRSHALKGKQSSSLLLMQPWRASLMDYLESKNRKVIANGPHYTRTMSKWGIQTFVESGCGPTYATQAHLGDPLIFSYTNNGFELIRDSLDLAGIVFSRLGEWSDLTFPFTPVELRSGVVIGKERILTNRSGQFGWADDSRAEVHVFDGKGQPVQQPDVRELRKGTQILTEVRMPSDHLAILVRRN